MATNTGKDGNPDGLWIEEFDGLRGFRLVLWLRTVSREVRSLLMQGLHVVPGAHAGFVAAGAAAHHHPETASLDAVAGSEFVDDRIRLLE